MRDLIYLLAVLACPVGMGLMMLLMMRGGHGNHNSAAGGDEVARLRAEVEQLRAENSTQPHSAETPSAS
jgi:hypothetical protein